MSLSCESVYITLDLLNNSEMMTLALLLELLLLCDELLLFLICMNVTGTAVLKHVMIEPILVDLMDLVVLTGTG